MSKFGNWLLLFISIWNSRCNFHDFIVISDTVLLMPSCNVCNFLDETVVTRPFVYSLGPPFPPVEVSLCLIVCSCDFLLLSLKFTILCLAMLWLMRTRLIALYNLIFIDYFLVFENIATGLLFCKAVCITWNPLTVQYCALWQTFWNCPWYSPFWTVL